MVCTLRLTFLKRVGKKHKRSLSSSEIQADKKRSLPFYILWYIFKNPDFKELVKEKKIRKATDSYQNEEKKENQPPQQQTADINM